MNSKERRAEIARLEAEIAAESEATEYPEIVEPASPPPTFEQKAKAWLIIGGAAVAGIIVLLLIIGSFFRNDDEPSTTMPSQSVVATETADESAYLRAIRTRITAAEVDDAAVLVAGRAVCFALDRGATTSDVYDEAQSTMGDDGVFIMAISATTLCREHLAAVQDFADSLD